MRVQLFFATALLAFSVQNTFADSITVSQLFNLGDGTYTSVNSVNNAGNAAGIYYSGSDEYGFTDIGGVLQTGLAYPGAVRTSFNSISNNGQIVGDYVTPSSTGSFSYDSTTGTFTNLVLGGVPGPVAYTINSQGLIGGSYSVPPDPSCACITGYLASTGSSEPSPVMIPGGVDSSVNGIDDAGQFDGDYFQEPGYLPASFYGDLSDPGHYSIIDKPGSSETSIEGIDSFGNPLGRYIDPSSSNFQGFIDVNGTFTTLDIAGAVTEDIYSLNAGGEFAGDYIDATGRHGFIGVDNEQSFTPEPSSLSLLICAGLAGIGLRRCRLLPKRRRPCRPSRVAAEAGLP